jgi:uncharacterized membrane protein YdjX (TVP38/TMEM64 family)
MEGCVTTAYSRAPHSFMHQTPPPHADEPASSRRAGAWLRHLTSRDWLVLAGILLWVLAVIAGVRYLVPHVRSFMHWVEGYGWWGVAAIVAAYTVFALLFLPSSIICAMAGVLYGGHAATALMVLAGTLASSLSFLISRYALRDWVSRWLSRHPEMQAVEHAVNEKGWKAILLMRLTPVFPYQLKNYGLGLTAIGFWTYALWTTVGLIPGTAMITYASAAAASAATEGVGWRVRVLYGTLIVAATLLVTFYATLIARRALRHQRG